MVYGDELGYSIAPGITQVQKSQCYLSYAGMHSGSWFCFDVDAGFKFEKRQNHYLKEWF